MLVLRIDHTPAGPNESFYKFGQLLEEQGNAEAWIDQIEIAGWSPARNSDAGTTAARSSTAQIGLLVFQDEHCELGPNGGLLRVDLGLDGHGRVTCGTFHPTVGSWSVAPPMANGRLHPTAITLADGSPVAFSSPSAEANTTQAVGSPPPVFFQLEEAWYGCS